jgi:hypothetical protein
MSVTYTLEPRDLRAFQRYCQKTLPGLRRMRRVMLVLFGCVSLWFVASADLPKDHHPFVIRIAVALTAVIFFLVLLGVWALLALVLTRLTQWRMLATEKNRSLLCEHTITLNDHALVETTAVNEARNNWSGIYQIKDDSDYIYVFLTLHSAHVIPKRAFPSPADVAGFVQQARQLHTAAARA